MQTKQQYSILVGIDPGVNTGFAVYDRSKKKLMHVVNVSVVKAMDMIRTSPLLEYLCQGKLLVRIEDARLRKWFGKTNREVLQGAGSIKRDCSVWEEFCTLYSIPYEFVAPKNNKTKLDDASFKKITQWPHRTSSHGRDAAMLVFGY